jgi:hypothetical protein
VDTVNVTGALLSPFIDPLFLLAPHARCAVDHTGSSEVDVTAVKM